jgi:hypothetical protein
VFFCPVGGSLASFIFDFNIDSTLNQVFHHLESVEANSVKYWRLTIAVYNIGVCSSINQLLSQDNVTLSNTVENGSLSISIQMVHVAALLDKCLHYLIMALTDSIVQRNLL